MNTGTVYRLYVGAMITDTGELPDCTIYHADGIWRGVREGCTIIEVVEPDHTKPTRCRMLELARKLAARYEQECVLVTAQPLSEVALVMPIGRGGSL